MKPHILVRSNVEDYDSWKTAFDEHGPARKAAGATHGHLFVSANDPNEVFILLGWDDMERLKQFAGSDDLREAMQRGGAVGKPDIYFLDEIGHIHHD